MRREHGSDEAYEILIKVIGTSSTARPPFRAHVRTKSGTAMPARLRIEPL
jgi:hypothetical protein